MIKAMVVDDEKLVRKGIISIFPWEQFGFEIIGEAGNGEDALQLLAEMPVDVIFVDLTMPVMGGLELLKKAGESYPDLAKVVLTCHQDFNYIQEAMRLGAIDYIVKTQLDSQTMEDVLERISKRLTRGKSKSVQEPNDDGTELYGYVLAGDETEDFPLDLIQQSSLFKINGGTWFISSPQSRDAIIQAQSFVSRKEHWIWLDVEARQERSISDFYAKLGSLVPLFLFYFIKPGQNAAKLNLTVVAEDRVNIVEEWKTLQVKWLNMKWIYVDEEFESLIVSTARLMPEPAELLQMLHGLSASWSEVTRNEQKSKRLLLPHSFSFWHQWVDWLTLIRQELQAEMKQYSYTSDVFMNLVKAIRHIQETGEYDFSRDELAARYLMSGSYFSQCFKEIMNKSYGEYVKEVRLNKAAHLLRESNRPIYEISEQTGFQDEKYFSKLFRQSFGVNPQGFRRQGAVKGDTD